MEARLVGKPVYSTDMTGENISFDSNGEDHWSCGCWLPAYVGLPHYCEHHRDVPPFNRLVVVYLSDCVVQATELQVRREAKRYGIAINEYEKSLEDILHELLARGLVTLLSKE